MSTQEKIQQLVDFAGVTPEVAKNLLEVYDGNLEMAIEGAIETNNYYSKYKEDKPWVDPNALNQPSNSNSGSRGMDIEKQSPSKQNSGQDFIDYVQGKFHIKGTKIQFIKSDLASLINEADEYTVPLVVFVNNGGAANEEHLLTKVFQDEDLSNLVNQCFKPIGILSSSSEVAKLLRDLYDNSKGCSLLLLKANNGRIKNPKAYHLSALPKLQLTPKYFEEKLGEYLSKFDNDSQNDQQIPGYNDGYRKYSDPQDIRNEQEENYRRMIEEENQKALEKRIEKEEQELRLKKEMSTQRRYKLEIQNLIDELGPEPKSGDRILIALKMPKGQKIQRHFYRNDPVRLLKGLAFSNEEIDLSENIRLLWNYPPQEITAQDMTKTLAELFGDSTKELVNVEDKL